MQAYRAAWGRCLERVQHILRVLQAPLVNEVATEVLNAYSNVLPGLPYNEVPVIALHGASSSVVQDIVIAFESIDTIASSVTAATHGSSQQEVLQVHLYPSDCSSVTNMMKGIVTGFTDRAASTRRKPTTSLASFDIGLLRAWYASQLAQPKLVIFLHDFETFDINVVQDALYILFILLMASPTVPSYLHLAYPRATLALLRVHTIAASRGTHVIRDVLTKTFFDPDSEPDVMLGPSTLDFITDFATRHSASPDALLAYMKHFTQPLSIFAQVELLGEASLTSAERKLTSPDFHPLVEALQVRLLASSSSSSSSATQTRPSSSTPSSPRKLDGTASAHGWQARTAAGLLECVTTARSAFRKQARRFRVAFAVACMAEQAALGSTSGSGARTSGGNGSRLDSMESLSAVLRGRASNQIRYVCMAVRKLSLSKLRGLLHQLHAFLWDLKSAEVRRDEEAARVWIVTTLNQLPPDTADPENIEEEGQISRDPAVKQLAATLGDWLQAYIEERLVRLDEQVLCDIWYTGNTPFPSELVNPAPRPTVVSALLHPHAFVRAHADLVGGTSGTSSAEGGEREPSLWELPDTSIAFRRYVEAGRMVNVYDWFESFAVVLETQRRKLRARARRAESDPATPRANGKANGRGRSRSGSRATNMDVDEGVAGEDEDGHDEDAETGEEDMDEEEEERWKVEVQARFIRALHELDYMGFVKHTGRKADHVIRTVYDIPD
ncbi:hypothetical protein OH77DRAFT_1397737 [Trametes cingulata]|nr:hypothetical protein OH77DRAFT_1397737 [Trametes cingulata]